MKPQRDIFDIFGDSARKMRVDPSSRAWKKLDRKMNRSRYGSQAKIYRLMAMAASIVLLLGVVTLMADKVKKRKTAMLGENIELTELASNDDFEGYEAVFISYNDYKEKKIVEGKEVAKFVVNDNAVEDLDTEIMIADVAKTKNITKQEVAKQKPVIVSEIETSLTEEEITPTEFVSTESVKSDPAEGFVISDESEQEEKVAMADHDMADVQVMDGVGVREEAPTAPYYKKRSSTKRQKTSIDTSVVNNLSQFEWLKGNWTEKRANGQSVENWEQVDANTMVSTGKLLRGTEVVYSENMSILQRGNEVVFKISGGDNALPIEYKFVRVENDNFFFENKSQVLNQLILRKIDVDSIQVVLESTLKIEVPVRQQQFLNQRNAVLSNSAKRNMSRVKNKKG